MDKHFGELGLGNNGRSGSSKRGKKNNSDKPKQPQRGLGVAQLEKIRLHDQMASYLPSLHSPFHSNLNKEDGLREEVAFSPSFYCSNSSSSTSASSPYHGLQANQQMMMFGDNETLDIRSYGDFSSCSSSSRLYMPNNVVQETVTLPLLEETMEDSIQKKRREDRSLLSTGSRSQNSSDKSDTQDIDLDLKL
ncbi:protein SPEAR1-like [Dioscorea cayenensis subsp. rotundata]|uniref:Protein SPEAR1-like n=1 Tax=Dioscorea cayennensis subsp. rotundata TaxID=55577 RepID=A0AB40ANV1_DIOCR|nr:protein SPEAR1-like [Dioscorea cayenensis subsp. rotundata]